MSSVGNKEIFDAINDLRRELRVEFLERFDKLETRVGRLENFQNRSLGVLVIVSAFFYTTIDYLFGRLTGKQ